MIGRFLEEFTIGEELVTPSRTMTEADIVMFAGLSGDYSPHHTDAEFIKTLPFKGKLAHGPLVLAISSGLIVSLNLWRDTALALLELNIRFKGAVLVGDTIRVHVKVAETKESKKGDRGVVTFDMMVKNQKDEDVAEIRWLIMVKTKKAS
ncbi:MAG: MaoC/PaaZ C-terminal domain-containing protein [Pseudomonadota bacterium]